MSDAVRDLIGDYGVDVFPVRDGEIARKDVYSSSHAPRVLG